MADFLLKLELKYKYQQYMYMFLSFVSSNLAGILKNIPDYFLKLLLFFHLMR